MQRGDMARVYGPQFLRRLGLVVLVALVLAPALVRHFGPLDPARILQAVADVGPAAWAFALGATLVSYLAVAGYDQVMHQHLATGVASDRAGRAGFAALAIGQTVGLGVLSGAMVRWRMLPELGAGGALRLSTAVSLSFLWAWAVLTGLAFWLLPSAIPLPGAPFMLGFLVLGAALGPFLRLAWAPNLIILTRILALAAVDCLAAGAAFWAALPPGVDYLEVVPVFLLALGAGLISGAPGGIGAFELVLVAGLPGLPAAEVLAAALAWRLVYLAVPALLGAFLALRSGSRDTRLWSRRLCQGPLSVVLPPEAGLAGQGGLSWHPAGFLVGATAHALVAIGGGCPPGVVGRAARDKGKVPLLYKLSPRAAVAARQAGFRVLAVAGDAWLTPSKFCLDRPTRAGLRRKLRRADAAGVTARLDSAPDRASCAMVNAAWVAARGEERGFSMGRFSTDRLGETPTVVARQGGRVVGFATFLAGRIGGETVWTLDLLRPDPSAPDGTAHLMILTGLAAARAAGVDRLSLAAVPIASFPGERGVIAKLERRLFPGAGDGLQQFKASFAPHWQRLYIAAPGWGSLALCGAELAREILRPKPDQRLKGCADMKRGPSCDAEYEFASDSGAWQRDGELAS